jgi:growth arrest-specific protein 1
LVCERSKESVAPCQSEVSYATQPGTIVSCSTAQWICAADPLCSTALDYYNRFCGAMFSGKRCTKRCLNSINILKRQASASKLENCYCDGTEKEYDCPAVKRNMARLCFEPENFETDNEIDTDGDQKSGQSSAGSLKARFQKMLLLLSVLITLLAAFVGGSLTALFQASESNEST